MLGQFLHRVREKAPLVHCITNYVTACDCANMLLACGASPIMADDPEDAVEVTGLSDALCVNIGTPNQQTIPAMFAAAREASRLGHALVLDPVGAGATSLRTRTAAGLLEEVRFTAIRGNISEIRAIAHGTATTRGVDAASGAWKEESLEDTACLAQDLARRTEAIVAISGPIDIVSDSGQICCIRNGRPMMTDVSGTGCQLSALVAAFIGASPDRPLEAATAAVCAMGVCGEVAQERMRDFDGNATYRAYLIDAMYRLTPQELEERAAYEVW